MTTQQIRRGLILLVVSFGIIGAGFYASRVRNLNAVSSLIRCQDHASGREQCYENVLVRIAKEQSPRAALNAIWDTRETLPDLFYYCHAIGHTLGSIGYLKARGDVRAALGEAKDISVCTNAYIHGVLIDYTEEKAHAGEDVRTLAEGACGVGNGASTLASRLQERSCYHGLGHGMMGLGAYDITRALALCRQAASTEEFRTSCHFGAFMEYMVDAHPESVQRLARADAPASLSYLKECASILADAKPICYFGVFADFLYAHPAPLDPGIRAAYVNEGFALCEKVPDAFRHYCGFGVGYIINFVIAADKTASRDLCLTGPTAAARGACLEGVARRYLISGADEAAAFCARVPTEFSEGCHAVSKTVPLP